MYKYIHRYTHGNVCMCVHVCVDVVHWGNGRGCSHWGGGEGVVTGAGEGGEGSWTAAGPTACSEWAGPASCLVWSETEERTAWSLGSTLSRISPPPSPPPGSESEVGVAVWVTQSTLWQNRHQFLLVQDLIRLAQTHYGGYNTQAHPKHSVALTQAHPNKVYNTRGTI